MSPRLRRADCSSPGLTRRRQGKGFSYLGNTPAVCRASYIDPRVIDAYNGGRTIGGVLGEIADTLEPGVLPIHQPALEDVVLDLLNERETSPALERIAA